MPKLQDVSYVLVLTYPVCVSFGLVAGEPLLTLGLAGVWLACVMVLDRVCGTESHASIHDVRQLDNSGTGPIRFRDMLLYGYVLLHLALLALGVYAATMAPHPYAWALYALPVGMSGAFALNIAHETMHTSSPIERFFSRLTSIPQFWTVHEFEHLYRHHRDEHICTESDKSYAKFGQSLYSYLVQAVISNYRNAWEIEKELLAKQDRGVWGLHNTVIRTVGLSVLLTAAIQVAFGWDAFLFSITQAAVSIASFVLTTYNQHYGLTRRRRPDGAYEEFSFMNVWSSDRYISNRLLFNLPRHAHHHLYPFCRHSDLKYVAHSPNLPAGVLSILLVSLVPPLWFRLMNHRVEEVLQKRDELDSEGLL